MALPLNTYKGKPDMFTTNFDDYACTGDTITCEKDGFTITAKIVYDDCSDSPDQRDDGFWPSKNPNDAGYIGENPAKSYDNQMKEAKAILDAWKNDEWFYCGIVLSVSKNGVMLDDHAASLWGIECNYPNGDKNAYLSEVANDLLTEAIEAGQNTLKKLI